MKPGDKITIKLYGHERVPGEVVRVLDAVHHHTGTGSNALPAEGWIQAKITDPEHRLAAISIAIDDEIETRDRILTLSPEFYEVQP